MRVKICGITTLQDALDAIELGADALGFVFYERSPRYITAHSAREIVEKLPPFVQYVGLFVDTDASTINSICKKSKMTVAQIHFDAPAHLYDSLDLPYIKVVRAQKQEDIERFKDTYRIVDAYCAEFGGVGKRLNLEWFKDKDCSKIILAGGLDPDNIKEVLPYNFYAVDVSSGVEVSRGKKDRKRVAEFIQGAKKA